MKAAAAEHVIPLVDDRQEHRVEVKIALSPGAQTRRAIRG